MFYIKSPISWWSRQHSSYISSVLNAEELKRIEFLQNEFTFLVNAGYQMPEKMSDNAWQKLLELDSQHKRILFYLERSERELQRSQKKLKKMLHIQRFRASPRGAPINQEEKNRFIRYTDKSDISHILNARLCALNTFAQPIVFDFSGHCEENLLGEDVSSAFASSSSALDCSASSHSLSNAALRQLAFDVCAAYSANRLATDPYHLHLTRLRSDSKSYRFLRNSLGFTKSSSSLSSASSIAMDGEAEDLQDKHEIKRDEGERERENSAAEEEEETTTTLTNRSKRNKIGDDLTRMPWSVSESSHLEVFPNRRLIYLSQDSSHPFELGEYDHTAVYVIGALPSEIQSRMSLANARRHRLENRSIPISRFVKMTRKLETLNLATTMKILIYAKRTNGDWASAIKNNVVFKNSPTNPRILLK